MAAITVFIAGAVVGGAAKWAYDQWQASEGKLPIDVAAARERSAAGVRGLRQSAEKATQSVRRSRAQEPSTPAAEDAAPPAAEE